MKSVRIAGMLAAATALAVPASAAAHPSVYSGTATIDTESGPGYTPGTETRHMVTNHGFTTVLRETNGVGAPGGVVSYALLPGDLRATLDVTQELAQGGTAAQAHATCSGVPALDAESAILGWQGTDPFYNYVPFQKAKDGLGDDPATWIEDVKTLTGVDLSTVSDDPIQAATELAAMCSGIGGTFHPADQTQSSVASLAAGTVEPLADEITGLKAALTDAEKAQAGLQALLDGARAEVAKLAAALAPMKVALPTARISDSKLAKNGTTVTVTGPVGKAVAVKLAIGESRARKLKLPSSTLARGKATLGANGTAKVALKPGKSVANRIGRLKRSLSLKVTAFAGDRVASTTGTLTR
jgi:hypothetical protein